MVIYGKAFIDTYKKETLLDDHKREMGIDFHRCTVKELCDKLKTNPFIGLKVPEAEERLEIYGLNEIDLPATRKKISEYVAKLFYGYQLMLWVAIAGEGIAVIRLMSNRTEMFIENIIQIVFLLVVVFVTAYFLCLQEDKSIYIGDTASLRMPFTTVRRDTVQYNIPTSNVVLGDLIELKFGDCVPADVRIIECQDLEIDSAILTGDPATTIATNYPTAGKPMYSRNLVYAGCNVVGGHGMGVVFATGNQTLMGRISALANNLESNISPLIREINHTAAVMKVATIIISMLMLLCAFAAEFPLLYCLLVFVWAILALVPEGFLFTISVMLLLIAKRTASKNCLIRNLTALATLGATSIIVTDTTGTITRRRMVGSHIWIDNQIIDVDLVLDYGIDLNVTKPSFVALSKAATLCNRAEFKAAQEGLPIIKKEVRGDPIEAAILQCMEACVGDVMNTKKRNPKVMEVLDEGQGYQVSIHRIKRTENEAPFLLCAKGLPEVILGLCTTIIFNGEAVPLTSEMLHAVRDAIAEFSGYGEHVIAFADYVLPEDLYPSNYKFDKDMEYPTQDYRFVGLISLLDPPKPGVADAIEKCRTGGIKVIMVTNDEPGYAKYYAKSIGIISEDSETPEDMAKRLGVPLEYVNPYECSAAVLDGKDIASMSTVQFNELIRNTKELVFANTTPLQKFAIVHSCQQVGGIVAVTGHHLSDIPSLKLADVGVGMFIASLEITKQYADVLLLDDNFASIVIGIEEGRLIFNNMKKMLTYILASNVGQFLSVFIHVVLKLPMTFCGVGMLMVDCVTDLMAGISLAYEPDEGNVMQEPPRSATDGILSHQLVNVSFCQLGAIEFFSCIFTVCCCYFSHGFSAGSLFYIAKEWYMKNITDYTDSFGQEWSAHDRHRLTNMGHSAFFASTVTCQLVILVLCKTRYKSVFFHGMRNHYLNGAMVLSLVLGMMICEIFVCDGFELYPLPLIFWICPWPFALVLFLYDEARRFTLRHHPGGFIEQETYY